MHPYGPMQPLSAAHNRSQPLTTAHNRPHRLNSCNIPNANNAGSCPATPGGGGPGVSVTAPGTTVGVAPGGATSVTAPGTTVNAGPGGTSVTAPFTNVNVSRDARGRGARGGCCQSWPLPRGNAA